MIECDTGSFGTLLHAFRKRANITQQQLASKIGMHRHAMSRWEQGEVLPASKAIVLELARHLRLDEQETRRLLEASLTAPVPLWAVPFPRNLVFTGREETLAILHQHLHSNQSHALTRAVALYGLGGVGKTQVALEYAYQHSLEYRAVFWLAAETAESIVSSLLSIAEALQLPGREDKDQQCIVAAVQRWLSTHPGWLLIWDNMEDPDLLRRFLPPSQQGAILLTTRRQVLGTLARGLELLPMTPQEGMLFLLRRARVLSPDAPSEQLGQFIGQQPSEYAAAVALVTAMGGLPLALDQAGAYLEETQCGLPTYLELFRRRRADLLQQRGEESSAHPKSVYTTFQLSITMAASRHPAVGDLLRICALLQPEAIPEELFRRGAEQLEATVQAACADDLEWNRVVALACRYSLLSRQAEQQTFSLHRLVQAVLLHEMQEGEQEQWTQRVVAALDAVFPEVLPEAEPGIWKRAERLLPHALLCLQRTGAAPESLASLAYKTAGYLHRCGQYEQAEPLSQRALAIWEHALGPDHPQVAHTLNSLARLYQEQGKYEQAEPLLQRALSLREQALGPDHPRVAYPLNSLARLYQEQGKYEQAEALYQRALSIWEGALGREHHLVATVLNGLANLYREQSHYRKAESLYQQALSIKERHLGPHHPETAQTLHDLATLYRKQGHLVEAAPLYWRALQIRKQALGDVHPQTIATRALYAQLIHQQKPQEGRTREQGDQHGML